MQQTDPQSYESFPYTEYGLSLRNAIVTGNIVNKLVISTWPVDEIPNPQRPIVEDEELGLLEDVVAWAPTEDKQLVQDVMGKLQRGEPYFEPNIDEIQRLYEILTEYNTDNSRNNPLISQIMKSIQPLQDDPDRALDYLMGSIWNTLLAAGGTERDEFKELLHKES